MHLTHFCEALLRAQGLPATPAQYQIRGLASGRVNHCWQLRANSGQAFFVKAQTGEHINQLHRGDEWRLQQHLFQHQLCPQPLSLSDDQKYAAFAWQAAPSLASATLDRAAKLAMLATTLHRIHQQRPPQTAWSMRQRVEHYIDLLPALERATWQHQWQHFAELAKRWDGADTFCHNDLAYAHILLSTPAQAVDWEYAGYGHPFFDIASAVEINGLQAPEVQVLCHAYAIRQPAGESPLSPQTLAPWRDFIRWMNDLWHRVQR